VIQPGLRPSRATGRPVGRPPKLAQRTRAHAIAAAEPMISVKALARRVGVSPERIRFWGIKPTTSGRIKGASA
jgi:transposase-like protein